MRNRQGGLSVLIGPVLRLDLLVNQQHSTLAYRLSIISPHPPQLSLSPVLCY